MKKYKISLLQYFCLSFFLGHSMFLYYSRNIIRNSGNDTLFACVLGIIFNFFLLKGFFFLKEKRKKETKILSSIFFFLLLLFTILILKEATSFVHRNFLKEGNIIYTLLLFILLSLIVSKRKIPQVASLAQLSFFIFLLFFASQVLGSMMKLDFSYRKPPLVHGIFPVLKGAFLFSFYTYLPLLLLLFIPKEEIDNPKKEKKYETLSLLCSNIVTILEFFMISLGPSLELAKTYDYPYMLVINQTASFLIFDRLSYFFSVFILLDSTILLGLLFTLIKELIAPTIQKLQNFNWDQKHFLQKEQIVENDKYEKSNY